MLLIVGLGNPGLKFKNTRHNSGFRVIDEIAANFQFSIFNFQSKSNTQISKGEIENEKVILIKPQTFMNESGRAVKALTKIYHLKSNILIIVHDDIDLPLEKIKIAQNRSAAGHKGVQSIINELKTKDFIRIRIGIKPVSSIKYKVSSIKREKFVLEKFAKEEEKIFKGVIEKTIQAIEIILKEGLEKAMTTFNN